jgi:2-polyprenyl-3-methyl-5-hydroxy-6-metoxy-1,4-benzoquinol methylase
MKDDKYYKGDRKDIISLIPNDVRFLLDVGCGFGLMSKRLKEKQDIEVVGIEKEEKIADIARSNLDRLIIGDAEDLKLPFKQGYFDCLVYGDILEHLKEPWKILREHTYYLKKGGYCIASIPNISHYTIIKNLIKNKWEYTSAGILDDAHLRFFTLDSIRKMFKDAGYAIEEEKLYIRASKFKRFLNMLLGGRIKHLLAEQYLIKGRLS